MFTGIIEETGTLVSIKHETGRARITIKAARVLEETRIGDSINVDGVCQTVSELNADSFSVFTLAESLKKTTLGSLKPGGIVNLERAARADTRMGGHIVQGHVGCAVPIRELSSGGGNVYLVVEAPQEHLACCVPEGSIALDGISLTIARISGSLITVNIIPATFERTSLRLKKTGDKINLETDVIGRYVLRLLAPYGKSAAGTAGGLSEEKLKELGF
ncbi:MAG: riboflavin synthase [Spirochaetales bacterium]|jgi:riboflavin synthase|nr:riboflavin synthase [Spirochaetales bacterium]